MSGGMALEATTTSRLAGTEAMAARVDAAICLEAGVPDERRRTSGTTPALETIASISSLP